MGERFPSGILYAGTVPLKDKEGHLSDSGGFITDTAVLTDGTPSRTYTIDTENIKNLFFDVKADKAGTVVITPLIDYDDDSTLGLPSDTGVFAVDTGFRGTYSDIATHKVKIVVTKTDAGDMTNFAFRVRGSVE